jgi:hypothetical protein
MIKRRAIAVAMLPGHTPAHNRVQSLVQLLVKHRDDPLRVGALFDFRRGAMYRQPKVEEAVLDTQA